MELYLLVLEQFEAGLIFKYNGGFKNRHFNIYYNSSDDSIINLFNSSDGLLIMSVKPSLILIAVQINAFGVAIFSLI